MTIWRFPLEIEQVVVMPEDAELLSVGNQNGELCLWAKCVESKRRVGRRILVYGTGNPIRDLGLYVGTAIFNRFVWHVFDAGQPGA
jgi:hypothetical protein